MHDFSGGHLGVKKTLQKCERNFTGLDVKMMLSNGAECVLQVIINSRNETPMRQKNVESPFKRIAIDIAGPFPESENKYILVVIVLFEMDQSIYSNEPRIFHHC